MAPDLSQLQQAGISRQIPNSLKINFTQKFSQLLIPGFERYQIGSLVDLFIVL